MLEARAFAGSSAFFLASLSGSHASAWRRRSCRSAAARSGAAARRRRVVLQLLLEPLHLVLGFRQAHLQGGAAAERSGTGTGADAHAVRGHTLPIDQVLLAQHGDRVGQHAVAEGDVTDAEIGQGGVVDGDAADEPAEGVVVDTPPAQGAGAADARHGSVQPQGREDARVGGGCPGAALDRADQLLQGREVQADDEVPNESGLVVGVAEAFQGPGGDDLLAVTRAQPRLAGRGSAAVSSRRQVAQGESLRIAPGGFPPMV